MERRQVLLRERWQRQRGPRTIPILGGIGVDFENEGTVDPRRTLGDCLAWGPRDRSGKLGEEGAVSVAGAVDVGFGEQALRGVGDVEP
jgi:hypothetical protein